MNPTLRQEGAGRGLGGPESLLEVLACAEICAGRPFSELSRSVERRREMLSGCPCVLLAFDEERRAFVERLRSLGVPVLAAVIAGASGLTDDVCRKEGLHRLEPGKIAECLAGVASWPKGDGVLALPPGACRIEGLPAVLLSRNRLGAVKASEAPTVVGYLVRYGAGAARDAPPDAADLELPAREMTTFMSLSRELGLARLKPRQALDVVARFFSENFHYSTFQAKASPEPLRDFLLRSRAGHCEYFATATVLLLRSAGIPARYAAGYSAQEYSRLEKAYVLRQRHAHAWTLAYVDGAWRDVDTTPGSWPGIERSRGSRLEPLSDLLSWARLRLSLWRWKAAQAGGRGSYAWFLLPALAAWMLWKASALLKGARRVVLGNRTAPAVNGGDSEFYAIEEHLGRAGLGRRPWEASADWIERIESALGAAKIAPLRPLLGLHYRYRFDPEGLRSEERQELRRAAESWLKENHAEQRIIGRSRCAYLSEGRRRSGSRP